MDLTKFKAKLSGELIKTIQTPSKALAAAQVLRDIQQALRESALELPFCAEELEDQARILAIVGSVEKAITEAFANDRAMKEVKEKFPALSSGR